ncbi:PREDICTED: phosphatidylinositide phosphatase SAC2-like isoform X3 [Branchiostoma belcheri]|uniref:Phosphatidylinositide phosphatase SAC2-like isoform X3 n=1 Tax=Branchiostoma belcheri TaxID=7741 RepID=A0A6P4ZJ81_BRABE|nr:PREDICTED: phosphatidylinositide phosphatase SAC2-like isoform X3 [Branchiostoma belcheri]
MELYQAHDHYILLDGEHSLWCSRFDGKLTARTGEDLCRAWNPVCLGLVHGVIGKVQLYPDSEWHLLLVTKKMSVGVLPGGHEVYKISRVVILPLSPVEPPEMELEWCRKHHFGISNLEKIAAPLDSQQRALAKTWNSIKSVAVPKKKRDIKEKEKLERRVFEELNKMFSDSDSFYYSPTGDLTNSVQRQHSKLYDTTSPLWRKVDPRFFWNTHMLNDLIQSEDPLSDRWIVPVIQGYVQMERFQVMLGEEDRPSDEGMEMTSEGRNFTITLISRRSRHRAGTRYKRRGVDETGACANFVETEQIIQVQSHVVSFVQVRGSVPIFWSQPGIRYRPPPRIDRGEVETQAAFEKHFEEQFDTYGSQVVANLVDQVGREKVIGDAFLTHILNLDSPKLTYITFDFHEHCRGMKFENVCVLVDSIKDLIRAMRYSWVDPAGVICEQQGVFRTNCMDCLDRTNVVQSAIARTVMEIQLRKLGLMMPDQTLPSRCRVVYQQMWANNGDAISRQYAGTAAMKGDFTRTGERKLAGVLNDGYKSANRYYLSRFKDAYRQATIDMMLGNAVSEDLTVLQSSGREEELLLEEREDHVAQLIEHCKQLLLPGAEGCAGGWALIDCDPGDGDLSQPDMDVILLLTQRAYYIAYYDEEAEKVTHYQRVNLEDLEKIELGPEPSVFKSRYYCMRVHHQYCGEVGYFHTLRSIGRGDDQSKGLLQAIADAFRAACEAEGHQIQVAEGKLDKRQTKPHEEIISISAQTRLSAWARTRFPRDHSADSISTVATVSQPTTRSFILSSVRNKISSFNPIRRVRAHTHARRVSLSKKSGGGIVYFQKGEESAGQADDEGANMSVRVTLSDSSSETESFDNLSLDDCEAILASCGQNNNKRKSLQELIVTEADDLVLESCGILASSPPSSHTRIHIMAGKGEEGTQGEDYTTPQTASDLDTDIRTMTSVAIKVVAPQEEENGAQQQDGNKVEDGLPTPESQSCQSTPQKQQQQPDAGATDSKTPDREDSKKNTILEFFKPARKIFELSLSVDSKFSSSPTGAGAEDDRVVDGESKEEAEELSQTGEEEEIQGDRGSTEEQNLAITAVPQSESTSPLATDSETPGKLGVEEPVAVNSIAEPNASAENTDFIKLSPLTKFRSLFSPSDRDASPRRNGDRQQNRQVESLELRLKMKNCKTQIIQL